MGLMRSIMMATLLAAPASFKGWQDPSWLVRLHRLSHPLPFLALLVVIYMGIKSGLQWVQWAVIAVYLVYLLP